MTDGSRANRGCAKVRYRSRVDALIALANCERRAKGNSRKAQERAESRVYRCARCRGWHLTSEPPDGMNAVKA